MKLFLTATSERGKPVTKSGNERLHIAIKGYDREDIIDLIVYARADGTIQGSLVTEKKGYNFIIDKPKTAREHKFSEAIENEEEEWLNDRKTAREVLPRSRQLKDWPRGI